MIGGRRVLAGEDRVADVARGRAEVAAVGLAPRRQAGRSRAPLPNRAASCAASSRGARDRRQAAAGAGIRRRGVAVRRGQRLRRCRPGCRSRRRRGPRARKLLERCPHRRRFAATGRAPARPIRGRASAGPRRCPSTNSGRLRVWSRSSILQQELAAAFARPSMAERGAIGVAEMQPPGRRRREPGDYHLHLLPQRALDAESLKMLS